MKLVTAIIKPFKLDEVREALSGIGVQRHYRDRSQGLRPPEGPTPSCIAARNTSSTFLPKVKIEAAVADDLVDRVIEAVEAAARTGKIGGRQDLCLQPRASRCASAPAKPARRRCNPGAP